MELILATGNAHKAEEFADIFDKEIIIKAAPQKLEVVEDGHSYFENALLKAKAYYDKFKTPVLADDSGLTVLALGDELGIHSARFGGEGLTDRQRAELLLEKMQGVTHREAYFTCVLCIYFNEAEVFYFEGRMQGHIAHAYHGQTGFGYDPIFIPQDMLNEGVTVVEVPEWKNKNSHRAQAVKVAEKFLKERI